MIIDVLINSCARPDSMDVCFKSFLKHIKTTEHEFRFVFVEDKVDNEERQALGKEWVEQNKNYFDEIVFLEKKAGFGYHFQEVIKRGKSPYFFRLEDDQKFTMDIDIDPLIEILQQEPNTCEIMFRRDNHRVPIIGKENVNGIDLTHTSFYSDSIGVHNLQLTKNIIDECGWENQLHEAGTLTPVANKLGYKKYILGVKKWFWQSAPVHYIHVGIKYRKGSWRI